MRGVVRVHIVEIHGLGARELAEDELAVRLREGLEAVDLARQLRLVRDVGDAKARRVRPRGYPPVLAAAPLDGHPDARHALGDQLAAPAGKGAGRERGGRGAGARGERIA